MFVPAPEPKRQARRRGLIVLAVAVAALVAVVALPVGFFGIRYALYETGPYSTLPKVCDTLTSTDVRRLIGDATVSDSSAVFDDTDAITGDDTNGCIVSWIEDGPASMAINVTYYFREWNKSSTGHAAQIYAILADLHRTETPISIVAETPVVGAGDRGVCVASQPLGGVSYQCSVLAGNAVVNLQFQVPGTPIEELLHGEKLTREQLADAAKSATVSYAVPFARDVVAGLS